MAINEAVSPYFIKNDNFPACHVSLMEGKSFKTLNHETTSRKRLAKIWRIFHFRGFLCVFSCRKNTHQVTGVMMAT